MNAEPAPTLHRYADDKTTVLGAARPRPVAVPGTGIEDPRRSALQLSTVRYHAPTEHLERSAGGRSAIMRQHLCRVAARCIAGGPIARTARHDSSVSRAAARTSGFMIMLTATIPSEWSTRSDPWTSRMRRARTTCSAWPACQPRPRRVHAQRNRTATAGHPRERHAPRVERSAPRGRYYKLA